MKKIFKNKKGFTLMEIIVVLIIIAVLAAALIPSFVRFAQNARAASAINEASEGMTAAQAVVTEVLASGHAEYAPQIVAGADITAILNAYGVVDGQSRFVRYLLDDVTAPTGFSGVTMGPGGLRVNGLVYNQGPGGFTVTVRDGTSTAVPN